MGVFDLQPARRNVHVELFLYRLHEKKQVDNLKVNQGEVDLNVVSHKKSLFTKRSNRHARALLDHGRRSLIRQTMTAKDIKNMSWAEDITRAVSRLLGVSSNDFRQNSPFGAASRTKSSLPSMEWSSMNLSIREITAEGFSASSISKPYKALTSMTGGFPANTACAPEWCFNMYTKRIPDGQKHTSVGLSIMNARVYTDGKFADNKGTYIFPPAGECWTLPSFCSVKPKTHRFL